MSTAAERVAARVVVRPKVPGGPWFVELRGPGGPVFLGPYENPALARDDAQRITAFVLTVLRDEGAAETGGGGGPSNRAEGPGGATRPGL